MGTKSNIYFGNHLIYAKSLLRFFFKNNFLNKQNSDKMVPSNPSNNPGQQGQQPQLTPTPTALQPRKSNGSPWLPIIIVAGLLLLGVAVWLTYESMSTTRQLEQKVAELEESEKLKAELEAQFNQAIAELDALKGDNQQINVLIRRARSRSPVGHCDLGRHVFDARKISRRRYQKLWGRLHKMRLRCDII